MAAWTAQHPTRDHVHPKSKGGRSTVMACYECNQIKGDMLPTEWAVFMVENPRWWERKTIKGPQRPAPGATEDWPWLKELTAPRVERVGWGPWFDE